jgi:group I intron endonuclease
VSRRANPDTGIIYLVTCYFTGKVYVGQTVMSLPERWGGHVRFAAKGSTAHLSCAIRLHGSDAFWFQVLESVPDAALNEREQFWIARYNANDPAVGYNMSIGGDGGRNTLSAEVRAKISKTKTGVKHDPCSAETKRKISLANSGRVRTPEQRERIRNSRPYPPLSADHRARISAGLRDTRVFKLPDDARHEIRRKLPYATDSALAVQFGVSRKMIWRMRKTATPGECPEGIDR